MRRFSEVKIAVTLNPVTAVAVPVPVPVPVVVGATALTA
jgi:hypothetical protein